jgi:hypothetical protein
MLDRTSVAIEHTYRLLYLCLLMIDRINPALKRISTVNTNRLEATKYIVFFKKIYILVYY